MAYLLISTYLGFVIWIGSYNLAEGNLFLAVFLGTPMAFGAWSKLSEQERQARSQKGMAAWQDWMQKHGHRIAEMGGPLGKTKKISHDGVSDISNELGGYTIVRAASHEEAADMFRDHPHFTIFPGDRVEVMPILPVPGM